MFSQSTKLSTDKHRSQLVYSWESHKEVCWGPMSYRLLPTGTYQPMITSWGANKYHGVTTSITWGVTINTQLSWQPQINKVQKKASKTTGLLKRTLHAAPPQVRQMAYEVLVWLTLEFAACAWAPHTKRGIHTLERIQRSLSPTITAERHVSVICALI